jgi:hypothetical protein
MVLEAVEVIYKSLKCMVDGETQGGFCRNKRIVMQADYLLRKESLSSGLSRWRFWAGNDRTLIVEFVARIRQSKLSCPHYPPQIWNPGVMIKGPGVRQRD